MDNDLSEMIQSLSCSDLYFLVREKHPTNKMLKEQFEKSCCLN